MPPPGAVNPDAVTTVCVTWAGAVAANTASAAAVRARVIPDLGGMLKEDGQGAYFPSPCQGEGKLAAGERG